MPPHFGRQGLLCSVRVDFGAGVSVCYGRQGEFRFSKLWRVLLRYGAAGTVWQGRIWHVVAGLGTVFYGMLCYGRRG